jgi:hypothetical protein
MKTLSLEQMETTEGGKFFGKDRECSTLWDGTEVCTCHFDVFWLRASDYWAC